MREEYANREVAADAIRPLLSYLQNEASDKSVLEDVDLEATRLSWADTHKLLHAAVDQGADLRAIGAQGITSAVYRFRKRIELASRVLTLEDALRFMLYPRSPVDFACLNVAVTGEPGRVDIVAYLLDRFEESPAFFELALGAAEEFVRLLKPPDGKVSMNVNGRQAHFVFTHAVTNSLFERTRSIVSHKLHDIYSLLVIRSSYPDLVHGRQLFEEQLIEHAKLETRLNESERAFERRAQQTDDIITEFEDGQLVYVSPNFERLVGLSAKEIYDHPERLVESEDLPRVREGIASALREGKAQRIDDFRTLDVSGNGRWVEATFNPIVDRSGSQHTIAVWRDVTERRRSHEERQRLDRQLEHTQRLEVVGVLAGGLAHDFNNLLMPILGQAELAHAELTDHPKLRNRMDTIKDAVGKASELVHQLMVYAGTEPSSFVIVDLAEETRGLLKLIEATIRPNVQLQVELGDQAFVRGDASQLRQVIMNLIINAAEAIGDEAGRIDLSVRRVNDSVVLLVSDDGCGMDELTRERVFEPFYSTKFAGRGPGLSAVMGIVRQHGGELALDSQSGQGTSFALTLAAEHDAVVGVSMPKDPVDHGSGRVLLADDDRRVRHVGKAMLESLGYQVELANDGAEALVKLDEDDFTALIVDLVMPKVDGREVLAAVRRRRPQLPVVVVSGYAALLIGAETEADPYTRFLSKPFRLTELAVSLSELTSGTEVANGVVPR